MVVFPSAWKSDIIEVKEPVKPVIAGLVKPVLVRAADIAEDEEEQEEEEEE